MNHTAKESLAFLAVFWLLLGVGAAPAADPANIPAELTRLSRAYLESKQPAERERLLAYARGASSGPLNEFAWFALGIGDHEAGKFAEAAEELGKISGPSELADYLTYYRARSLAGAESHEAATSQLADFGKHFPESRLTGDAVRLRAVSFIRSNRSAQARQLLEASKPRISEPVRLFYLARIEEIEGNLLKAVETYRRAYYYYPLSAQATEAEKILGDLSKKLGREYPPAPPAWRLARADALFDAGRFADAGPEFRLAVPGLGGEALERARLRSAASDYRRVRTTAAYQALSARKFDKPEYEAERLYYLGECSRRLKRAGEFRARVEELAKRFPKSEWYHEALFSLGNFYLLENSHGEYRNYYDRAAREFPNGKYSALAHWKVCWRAYLDRDPRARALLEQQVTKFPGSDQAATAMFWLGRLAEKDRNPRLARAYYAAIIKHYPLYYYALQARNRLDEIGPAPAQASGPALASLSALPRPRSLDPSLTPGNRKIVHRGRLLDGMGLSDLAASELRTADYRKPDGYLVGLELFRQAAGRGDFHYGLRMMKRYGFGYLRLGLDEVSREFWEALFPLPWGDELHSRASLHGIDPYLVAGLIRQESEFDPNARSHAGALGLMQIMPATGRSLARKAGIARHDTQHLFNPERSLSLGTLHFREVLDRFGGDLIHTLAGYNAGESRVGQWVLRENFEEPAEFVESIPFTETRGYVQSVLRNAEVYRRLYAGEIGESQRSAE